jgi:hypothetical protein
MTVFEALITRMIFGDIMAFLFALRHFISRLENNFSLLNKMNAKLLTFVLLTVVGAKYEYEKKIGIEEI